MEENRAFSQESTLQRYGFRCESTNLLDDNVKRRFLGGKEGVGPTYS